MPVTEQEMVDYLIEQGQHPNVARLMARLVAKVDPGKQAAPVADPPPPPAYKADHKSVANLHQRLALMPGVGDGVVFREPNPQPPEDPALEHLRRQDAERAEAKRKEREALLAATAVNGRTDDSTKMERNLAARGYEALPAGTFQPVGKPLNPQDRPPEFRGGPSRNLPSGPNQQQLDADADRRMRGLMQSGARINHRSLAPDLVAAWRRLRGLGDGWESTPVHTVTGGG